MNYLERIAYEVFMPNSITRKAPTRKQKGDDRLDLMVDSYCFARDRALFDYFAEGSLTSLRNLGETERALPGDVRIHLLFLSDEEIKYVLKRVAKIITEMEGTSFGGIKEDPLRYALDRIEEHEEERRQFEWLERFEKGDIGFHPN